MVSIQSILAMLIAASIGAHTSVAWMPASSPGVYRSLLSQSQLILQTHKSRSHPSLSILSANNRLSMQPSSSLRSSAVDLSNAAVSVVKEHQESSPLDKLSPIPPPPEPPLSDDEIELKIRDKIVNGLFLSAAFGYALYTIFSIDQGITRGWTGGEIAMRIPLDNWGAYESYLANKPVVTKTLINVIIYLLGDWLSQTAFQGKNVLDFDLSRTCRNGFIGLCFGPLVHEYYQFSDSILPPEDGMVIRLQKILMDQTLYLTIKCSVYIGAVGLLGGDDWQTVQQNVKDKIGGVVVTAWKFWPLIHCITYGLVPARHRILWVNSVDLVWNAILASQAQKTTEEDEVPEAEYPSMLLALAEGEESSSSSSSSVANPHHHDVDDRSSRDGNETLYFNQKSLVVELNPSATTPSSPVTNTTSSAVLA